MTAILKVLVPISIANTTTLFSSTATEADYTVYNPLTTYVPATDNTGRCISTVTHRVYESLRTGNIGHDPTDIKNRVGTAPWWLDVTPTNKFAMFDGEVSTPTTVTSPLTVVIRAGRFNSLYLAGLDADTLTYTVKDAPSGNVLVTQTIALEGSAPDDYYEYFNDPFSAQTDYIASDIPPYSSMELTLTLSKSSGSVSCGMLSIGDMKPLGKTLSGAKAKPKTYAYIKEDEFGNNVIKRRKSAKDMSLTAYLEISEVNSVLDTITGLLDVACIWIATDSPQYTGLRVFGLGSAEISYDSTSIAMLTLNVKGLI